MNDLELDAGHGGADPGAIGPTGLKEKDVTLKLVKKAGALIAAQGFSVGYTRTTDIAVGLDQRAALAGKPVAKYKEFISIHINSAAATAATGTEVFSYSAGSQAAKLAAALLKPLVATIGKPNRGLKTANFAVLRETVMPAALIEVLFISNPTEEALLKSDAFLDKVALAIAVGYCAYKGKTYKTATPAVVVKPAASSVAYRVILDGKQVIAFNSYDDAVAEVRAAVDSKKAASGKVQRNTDAVDLFTYTGPTQATGYIMDLTKKLEAAQTEADGYRLQSVSLVKQLEAANNKLTAVKQLVN